MCIQCSQVLIVWFVRKDHHLVLRRSLSAVAEGCRRGRAANGRKNTELLSHWPYECPNRWGAWLTTPGMPQKMPFEASNGHSRELCSSVCLRRAVTISFTPRT